MRSEGDDATGPEMAGYDRVATGGDSPLQYGLFFWGLTHKRFCGGVALRPARERGQTDGLGGAVNHRRHGRVEDRPVVVGDLERFRQAKHHRAGGPLVAHRYNADTGRLQTAEKIRRAIPDPSVDELQVSLRGTGSHEAVRRH